MYVYHGLDSYELPLLQDNMGGCIGMAGDVHIVVLLFHVQFLFILV
jgi:hypothetical protein